VITAAPRIEDGLIHLARQRNGTQIVVGKPQRSGFEEFLRGGTLVDKLIRSSGEIDVYVVTGDEDETGRRTVAQLLRPTQHSTWVQYLFAVAIIAGVTLLDYLVHPTLLSYQAVGLTELFAVLLIAVYIGRGPALLAAAVSAISWNFLFITPRFTFVVTELQDVILLLLYFVIALLTGNVTAKLRTQERQARQTADRTMALYALARSTATAVTMDDVLRTAIREIGQVFDADVAILLANGDQLERTPHPDSTLTIDEKDFSVAMWAFENGRPAGRHTDTLPGANARYLPLVTPSGTLGVIGVRRRIAQGVLEVEREVLLEALVNTVALVIERERLDEAAEQAAMLREAERLYTALLNSISHELRTPIATIAGASSSLMNPQTGAHEESRLALTSDIQDAAERLNNLVENLLDMSRLDSGHLTLKRDWTDVCDLIGVAVRRMQKRHTQHPISVDCPPDLPLVSLDFVLMEQVIVNLLDNACKYTPPGVAVRVNAAQEGDALLLRVTDAGQGLPPDDLERVFDKFYRVPGTATGGTGLGLSICRGLVEAHGGTLTAANVPDGGAQFTIRLMPGAPPPPVHEAQERG
jgi:two-component system, OmpR family, sensor histidine kinase KdpD